MGITRGLAQSDGRKEISVNVSTRLPVTICCRGRVMYNYLSSWHFVGSVQYQPVSQRLCTAIVLDKRQVTRLAGSFITPRNATDQLAVVPGSTRLGISLTLAFDISASKKEDSHQDSHFRFRTLHRVIGF
jgi:hypothetical protein